MINKVLTKDGTIEYRNQQGDLHNVDLPAKIRNDGTLEWYHHGKRHREGFPAIIKKDGYYEWRLNDIRHRLDGPAMEWPWKDRREYYVDGKEFSLNTLKNINKWLVENNINYPFTDDERIKFEERWRDEMPKNINERIEWRVNGILHREDGPALTLKNGDRIWYLNGTVHNDSGPAIITGNNVKKWYKWGKLHRENAPAITRITEHNEWWFEGKRHRMDGPAVINGNISKNGKNSGHSEWWIDGIKIASEHSHYGKMNAWDKFNEIIKWLNENNISTPFSDEDAILFKIRWCT